VARWARSASGSFLNLDRIDGIEVLESTPGPGQDVILMAERLGAPNVILGRYPSRPDAEARVCRLLGDDLVGDE